MKPDLMIVAGGPAGPSDGKPGAADAAEGSPSDEQYVPVDALAMPGEDDQMTNPEVGDTVTYQVEGKVVSLHGPEACVQPTAINGKPIADGDDQEPKDENDQGDEPQGGGDGEDAQGLADLEKAAQQQGPM